MAKIDYVAPVEAVHGKLSKEDRYGFSKRKAKNAAGERKAFSWHRHERTKPFSADEKLRQTTFTTRAQLVSAVLKDEVQYAKYDALFQKTKYAGKTTFRAWLWAEAKAGRLQEAAGM